MAKLRVRLGERVLVETAAGRPLRLTTRHEGLLLGALALANGRELNRKRLAHLLWPDNEPDAAMVNLRRRLADLRRLVGPFLEADRTCISMAPGAVEAFVDPNEAILPSSAAAVCRRLQSSADQSRPRWTTERLRDWLTAWSAAEVLHDEPDESDASSLLAAARSRRLSAEERLLAACGAACALLATPERRIAWRLAAELPSAWRREPELLPAWARLYEIASTGLHRSGHWAAAASAASFSAELCRRASLGSRLGPAQFRRARIAQDMGQFRWAYQEMLRLAETAHAPGARSVAQTNLIFAHTLAGRFAEAEESAESICLGGAASASVQSWAWLNLALTHSHQGQPARAAAAISRADESLPTPDCPLQNHWLWRQAAHAFAANESGAEALICDSLARRAAAALGDEPTPINRQLMDRRLVAITSREEPHRWMGALAEADAIPLQDAHGWVTDQMRRKLA